MSFEAIITSELEAATARIIQRIQQQLFGGAPAPGSTRAKTPRQEKLTATTGVEPAAAFVKENPGTNFVSMWPSFKSRMASKAVLKQALSRAVGRKLIQSRGERRAMVYFAADHTIVSDAPNAAAVKKETSGSNRARVLEYIQKHPGLDTAAVAKALGLTRQPAYRAIYSLWQEGRITDSDGKYTAKG